MLGVEDVVEEDFEGVGKVREVLVLVRETESCGGVICAQQLVSQHVRMLVLH